jgi:hypothetical protein
LIARDRIADEHLEGRVIVGSWDGDGLFTFVLGDGSVYTTKNVVDATLMHALITRNGGEVVNLEDLDR